MRLFVLVPLLSACSMTSVMPRASTGPGSATATTSGTDPEVTPAVAPVSDGRVERPGGALSRDPRNCDAANDHCLRPGTWFALMATGDDRVHPVFTVDGRWYDWDSLQEVSAAQVYRTAAAVANDLAPGATVVFFQSSSDPRAAPPTEAEAYSDWRIDKVAEVDASASTFEWGRGSMDVPIENARVIIESR